jgi:hypothetical protein
MPVEKGDSSDSHVSSDARKDQNSFPHWLIHKEEGPGIVGLELSRINERLRDLETDNALPTLERKRLQAFYTRERSKLRLRLAVLGKTEKVKSAESAFEEIGKALDCTRSEAPRLGEDEVRTDDCRRSLAEALLIKTRSELQAASSALEELRADDRSWDDQKAAARRWELSRKWEAITPDELRPAVEALRYRFEHYGCSQSSIAKPIGPVRPGGSQSLQALSYRASRATSQSGVVGTRSPGSRHFRVVP